jgi:hypothetical protein
MRAISCYASVIVTAAMMASASGAYAQDNKLSIPNVTVTAPAAPVAPPYVDRGGFFGRYRVEEDKFVEVPCTTTRIAFGPGGKCLQGYRLGHVVNGSAGNTNNCEMALDVVIDTTGKLTIEADILVFDPHRVTATGSPPQKCYVGGQWRYNEKNFQDMNQVTRRGTNWHNLQINDMQDQWYVQDRLRSIEFSDGPHNCIAVRKPGPVWRGGFIYMMHASICRTDTTTVQAEDVAYVLGSLQTRIYDPAGNLRQATDPTTYGPTGNQQRPGQ